MKFLIVLVFACSCINVQSQENKPPLKLGQVLPYITDECISADGRYILYKTNSDRSFLTLYDVNKKKNTVLPFDGWSPAFDAGSGKAMFRIGGDSLCFIQLASGALTFIGNVKEFQVKDYERATWAQIGYNGESRITELVNTSSGKSYRFSNVNRLHFFRNTPQVLLQRSMAGDISDLLLLNLQTGQQQVLWSGQICLPVAISNYEKAIAFGCKNEGSNQKEIRSIDLQTKNCIVLMEESDSLLIRNNFLFQEESSLRFVNLDSSILFNCVAPVSNVNMSSEGLNIYRYTQDKDWPVVNMNAFYTFAVNRFNRRKLLVTNKNELLHVNFANNKEGKLILKTNPTVSVFGMNWMEGRYPALLLLSLNTGVTDTITERIFADQVELSPDSRYVLYYDRGQRAYFSYDIDGRRSKNISASIPFPLYKKEDIPAAFPSYGIAGWNKNKGTVLINDEFDIWEVDYRGNDEPRNITGSRGRQHHQVFRLLRFEQDNRFEIPVLDNRKSYFLTSVDKSSLQQGFYLIEGLSVQTPQKLFQQPVGLSKLQKAKHAETILLRKESADHSPELCLSKDFRNLEQISFLNASESVNWMTAELITMQSRHGVLYKPENFDPGKKYPVIFSVYDKYSERFHEFLFPKIQGCILDIPFYVSNGYCVFVPDLYYTIGMPGKSVSEQLEQWVDTLCTRTYIDKSGIGIQGHSWGGYEVNFTITQTNRFAAAVAASGVADMVSQAHSGGFSVELLEWGQSRIGKPFFIAPELYTQNSPVYHTENVSTPLLLMTGTDDHNVPSFQSKEMFYALKRQSKRVWMLEYLQDAHVLSDSNGKDFDRKTFEFFNYFLKRAPRPDWL